MSEREKFFVRKTTIRQRLYNRWIDLKNLFKVKYVQVTFYYLPEELDVSEEEFYAYVITFNLQLQEFVVRPKFYRESIGSEAEKE